MHWAASTRRSSKRNLAGGFPDENLQNYVNQMGQRIARVCHRPDLSYYFAAVEEGGANAIAVPGGYVYITRGLLKELKSEAQLAAVLGHEVGHVVARDTHGGHESPDRRHRASWRPRRPAMHRAM